MSAQAFVVAGRELVGAKWRHRGRKAWAVDCIGLIVLAGRKANIVGVEAEPEIYGREPWDDRLRKELQTRFGKTLQLTSARPGDVALIRWGKCEPSHLGIVGDSRQGLTLIHAHSLHGVIEQSLRGSVAACVVEVYRPTFGDA